LDFTDQFEDLALLEKALKDDNITGGIPCYIQNIHILNYNSITVIH